MDKTLTSITCVRFEELRQGILDGSLGEWLHTLDGIPRKQWTRKQQVKFRQITALLTIFEGKPDLLSKLVRDREWKAIEIKREAETERIYVEIQT